MDRKQQAALGLSLLLAAFYAGPAVAGGTDAAPAAPAPAVTAAGPADFRRTSWTELAQQYGNPYFTEEAQAALSPDVLAAWWTVFHDDVLDGLIRTALTNSRDLAAARSRLNQARARLGIAKAARLPWLDAAGGWVRSQVPDNVVDGVLPEAVTRGALGPYDAKKEGSYAGLDATWELDVFGKTRARVRSASNSLQTRNAQLYSAWVSLSAEVALNYITLRTLQEELAVTERHVANLKENRELVAANEKAGLLSSLPADQASYTLHAAEARIPALKEDIADTLNRLSVLTGTVPGALNDGLLPAKPLPDVDPRLYNAIPAGVLRQRPDVHAAERAWAAQIAKTSEAKAEMKPRFTISGLLGFATLDGGLFSAGSRGFSLLPQVTFPLFHGGALAKNVRVQKEKEKELQADYEKTVLQAAAEVRSSMTAISQDHERRVFLEQGRAAARDACGLAQNRFRNGLSDYLDVLDAERQYLQLDQNFTEAKGRELTSLVSLFKALGGGWEPLGAAAADDVPSGRSANHDEGGARK